MSILAILGAIYYGPQKMLQTWDWYIDRFRDRDVIAVLKNRIMIHVSRQYAGGLMFQDRGLAEAPYYVGDIAKQLKRSERSVAKSLHRLYARDKVEHYQGGWRLKT